MDAKKRVWLSKNEALSLGIIPKENEKNRNQARYSIKEEDWEYIVTQRMNPNQREFVEVIKKLDKNGNLVSTTEKLQSEPIQVPEGFEISKISTSKTTGQQWIQYLPKKEAQEVQEFDIDSIISKHIKSVKIPKIKPTKKSKDFDVATITDVHIGMETNKYENSMYPVSWNYNEVIKASEMIVKNIIHEKESNDIYIDDLGDLLDGFDGKTTRGGHDLPQNMTNEQAFDCALQFKINVVEGLLGHYQNVYVNNICNDNHAGAFGYFVNSAMKSILEIKYKNVSVTNHRKFINHYYVNDICFVITHGKDDKSLKFGFKPQLKPDSIEKIDQYLKQNNVYKKSKLIVFKKGDSHQALFDMCTSDDFYYFNYPALSPSSQWVQNNFKKGRRGFVVESYKGLDVYIKPKFINNDK